MESLFRQLCSIALLHRAWKCVKSKNRTGGIDGMTVARFDDDSDEQLRALQRDLERQQWQPEPYLRIEIRKNGATADRRQLGLSTVRDKIVQQAIKLLIEPRFERLFLDNNYGYRPQRGHTRAIRRTWAELRNRKNSWVVRLDIENYFDTIDRKLLFSRLKSVIADEELLRLIDLCMATGVVSKRLRWSESERGIPQGAVLSPLLANFYLHPFDQFVRSRTTAYVRYADDLLIACPTREACVELAETIRRFLTERLRLRCHDPVFASVEEGVEFLGVVVKRSGIALSEKKRTELADRIRAVELDGVFLTEKSRETLNSLRVYYGALLPEVELVEFDRILTERIDALIESSWRNFRNRRAVEAFLREIPFCSGEYEGNRKAIRAERAERYVAWKRQATNGPERELNRKLIDRKKREYRKREGAGAEWLIDTFGCFVGVNRKGLSVKQQGRLIFEQQGIPPEHITVANEAVSLSAAAVRYCMDHRIPVDFFDRQGKHYASVLSLSFLETTLWRVQAGLADEKRFRLAVRIVYGKLKNQLHLVKYFHKYHKGVAGDLAETYRSTVRVLEESIVRLKNDCCCVSDYRVQLVGVESVAAVAYWEYVRTLIADDGVAFESRERKGAGDLVNVLLNYGYALVYPRVWQALLAAKLNPTDSVIHVRQDRKPTLAYDLIELFRAQAVDRVVIALIQKREPLRVVDGRLTDETKTLLIRNVLERLHRYEKYRGTEMTFSDIIIRQAKEIASFMTEGGSYRPYIAKW